MSYLAHLISLYVFCDQYDQNLLVNFDTTTKMHLGWCLTGGVRRLAKTCLAQMAVAIGGERACGGDCGVVQV